MNADRLDAAARRLLSGTLPRDLTKDDIVNLMGSLLVCAAFDAKFGTKTRDDVIDSLAKKLTKVERKETRLHDERGQLVTVNNRYAYRWLGARPLTVGEKVYLPRRWIGTVTALGTDYDGDIVNIIGRAAEVPDEH